MEGEEVHPTSLQESRMLSGIDFLSALPIALEDSSPVAILETSTLKEAKEIGSLPLEPVSSISSCEETGRGYHKGVTTEEDQSKPIIVQVSKPSHRSAPRCLTPARLTDDVNAQQDAMMGLPFTPSGHVISLSQAIDHTMFAPSDAEHILVNHDMDPPSPNPIIQHILSLPDSSYPPLQRRRIRATLQAVLTDSQTRTNEEASMAKREIYIRMLEEQWRRQGKQVPPPIRPEIPEIGGGIGNDIAAAQTYNPITRGVFGRKLFCSHWLRTGECDFTQQGCNYLHIMPDVDTMQRLNMKSYPRWFREMPHAYQQTNSFELDEQAMMRGSLDPSAGDDRHYRRSGRPGKARNSRAGRRQSPHSRGRARPGDLKRKRSEPERTVYVRSPEPPGKRPPNYRFMSNVPSEASLSPRHGRSRSPPPRRRRSRSPVPPHTPRSQYGRQQSPAGRRSRSPAVLATPQPRRLPQRSPSILTSFGTPAPDSLPPRPMSVMTTFSGSLGTGRLAYEPDFAPSILDDWDPTIVRNLDRHHETRILHPPPSEYQYPGHYYPSSQPISMSSWHSGPNAAIVSHSQPGQQQYPAQQYPAQQTQIYNTSTFSFTQPQKSGSFLKQPTGKHPLPRNPMLPPAKPQSDAIDLTKSHLTTPVGRSSSVSTDSNTPVMRDAAGQPIVFKGTGFHRNVITDDEAPPRPPPGPRPGTLAFLQAQRHAPKRGLKRSRAEDLDDQMQEELRLDTDTDATVIALPVSTAGSDVDDNMSDTPTDMRVEY